YARLEAPLLEKLGAQGYRAASLDEFIDKFDSLPANVVPLLLEFLDSCEDARECEIIVRALSAAQCPFDGRPLTRCYDRIRDDEAVRWMILNTISLKRPQSIDNRLEEAREDPYRRKTLEELGYAW